MPLYKDVKKVLVIGSGPIVIGQAAEFDYAGTQACKSLKEEGVSVVLVNSNPATIMTDINMADKIYLEPLNITFIEKIIEKERPDSILPTLGGQTGLNMAVELSESGILDKYNVRLLGTPVTAIKEAEDRELFRQLMNRIDEPIPPSKTVDNIEDAIKFVEEIGFPVIIRPAYTLGGGGGGLADNLEQFINIANIGFKNSRISQILVEKSVAGWKEIEYEVLRDSNDTTIIVCTMENIDPVGIHTGDSIVVAPVQTITPEENDILKSASHKIIKALKIEGGCNIQFGLNPETSEYIVIEVNPRVSRSSALASKATGYPIARVASKIALGFHLSEIENTLTKTTKACVEPAIDYVVLKISRWPFDKFISADRSIGTQMKATGEVMAIDRIFEGALQKGIRSLEIKVDGPFMKSIADMPTDKLVAYLKLADDRRLFVIFELLRRNYPVDKIVNETKINFFFIKKFENIINLEKEAKEKLSKELITDNSPVSDDMLNFIKTLKLYGFSDTYLSRLIGVPHKLFREFRKKLNIIPVYKMVDTCAAEVNATTPYYYSCYDKEDESIVTNRRKIVVLGSGPIRIGQGIEFDYCSVHSVWGLKEENIEAIIINNNPETVSTDFDTSDKLYFEPLNIEDVLNIIDKEKPEGIIVQFGGQTAINLGKSLIDAGVNILGTSFKSIDIAEDRKKFRDLIFSLSIAQPEGKTVYTFDEALGFANKLNYPLLVRPSYVIGGQSMEIVYDEKSLFQYIKLATEESPDHPILVDQYLSGREVDVDVISDGDEVFIAGIFEQLERAGIHSGDSMAIFPPTALSQDEIDQLVESTIKIGRALKVVGLMNIQYIISNGKVYCIEVNPRASRTVPIISKVANIEMVKIATKLMAGKKLKDFGLKSGLMKAPNFYSIKVPIFSFDKLKLVETSLGPEMKSTGEVLGVAKDRAAALYKSMLAAGLQIQNKGNVLLSFADKDKNDSIYIADRLHKMGFKLFGTKDSASFIRRHYIEITDARIEDTYSVSALYDFMKNNKITLVINTPTEGKKSGKIGFKIRRVSVEYKIPCITSIDTAVNTIVALEEERVGKNLQIATLEDFING